MSRKSPVGDGHQSRCCRRNCRSQSDSSPPTERPELRWISSASSSGSSCRPGSSQAEHNLDPTILREDNPNRKPDNLCELTSLGRRQARSAGERIRKLLGNRGVISVIVSPFERTQQTLYALQQELGNVSVRRVHIDPRVREQEFGNFQRDMAQLGKDANEVRRRDSSPGCWLRTGIYGPARVPASAGGALLLPAADGRERR